jgi:hypothetical protein
METDMRDLEARVAALEEIVLVLMKQLEDDGALKAGALNNALNERNCNRWLDENENARMERLRKEAQDWDMHVAGAVDELKVKLLHM